MWLFAPKAKKTLRVAADRLWTGGEEQAASHKAHRDATSVRSAVIITTCRPPSRLLSHIISFWPHSSRGSGTRCLLKLVERVGRDKGRRWEIGAKVKPECYNCPCESGPACVVKTRRYVSSWLRGSRPVHTSAVQSWLPISSCHVFSCMIRNVKDFDFHTSTFFKIWSKVHKIKDKLRSSTKKVRPT